VRLDKLLSSTGLFSRKEAVALIRAGRVTVSGLPERKADRQVREGEDAITLDGAPVIYTKYDYIFLNKPAGYVTTTSDEKGRPCVTDLIKGVDRRVYPIGRLDMASEGLLLLTDDGELTKKLTHPSHDIPKIYNVKVDSEITEDQYKLLLSPMEIDGYQIRPVYTEVLSRGEGRTLLQMTLYEGRNRQIRKMCEQAGLRVRHLKRIAIGKLTLGRLRRGEWRYLTSEQVSYLKGVTNNV
jgi:23S rRNA pseudouridine2605 synthase